jgi:hypothetical protein
MIQRWRNATILLMITILLLPMGLNVRPAFAADTTIVQVTGGQNFTVAVRSDGSVWTWGDNLRGELGNGSINAGSPLPVQVIGLTNVVSVSEARWYGLGLGPKHLWTVG